MGDFEPKTLVADGQSYDYKRTILEVLECQTCRAHFITHMMTGHGTLMTEKEDSELCAGCLEMCKSVNIIEESGAKPS